jgi:Ca-activated chloride channel family protein
MNWEAFHFLRPTFLWAFIPTVLFVLRFYQIKSKRNFWADKVDKNLLPHLLVNEHHHQSRFFLSLLFAGWSIAIIALAGPTWEKLPSPSMRGESALVIALDLSRSMDADDLYPSRLEALKSELLQQLKNKKEGSVGLVLFAEQAFLAAPISEDASTTLDIIKHTDTAIMPAQGSRPDRALLKALELLERDKQKQAQVLLITDGAYDKGAFKQAAAEITENNYLLSIVAVGTESGGSIPELKGRKVPKNGFGLPLKPKLDTGFLRSVAEQAGANFFSFNKSNLKSTAWIHNIKEQIDQLNEKEEQRIDQWHEYGPYLLFLLVPFASLAFRRGWLGAGLLPLLLSVSISLQPAVSEAASSAEPVDLKGKWRDLWIRQDYQAYQLFKNGLINNAAEKFEDPSWKAAAWYRLGQFDKAAHYYAQLDSPEAHFNRGNALVQQGKLKEALDAFNKTLDMDIEFRDASYNRQLVEEFLESKKKSKKSTKPKPQQQNKSQQKPKGPLKESSEGASKNKKFVKQDQKKKEKQNSKKKDKQQDQKIKGKSNDKSGQKTNSKQVKKNEASDHKALAAPHLELKEKSSIGHAQWLNMIIDSPSELLRLKFAFIQRHQGGKIKDGEEAW